MTKPEALQLLIEKCPEIVIPMFPSWARTPVLGSLAGIISRWTAEDYEILEARIGRWLREKHACLIGWYLPPVPHGTTTISQCGHVVISDPDSFTAHALAVVELAKEPTND